MYTASLNSVRSPAKKRWRVTEQWRSLVLEWIGENGHGARRELARVAGCKESTITKLLDGTTSTSPLVEPISQHVGLTVIHESYVTEEVLRIYEKLGQISEEDYATLESVVDAYLAKSKS